MQGSRNKLARPCLCAVLALFLLSAPSVGAVSYGAAAAGPAAAKAAGQQSGQLQLQVQLPPHQALPHQHHLADRQQMHRALLQQQQTPAQLAAARWYERHRKQQQQHGGAGTLPADAASAALPPAAQAAEFVIPVPPPGAENPHEVQPPLYSPDQLRLRHKLIPGVPLDSQVISLMEQVQQAAALKTTLTAEQLQNANPLLGPKGPVKVPEKASPDEFPDGYVAVCLIAKNQHRDIREWLEYHRWLGVSKVYVYDNNSTVPLSSSITDMLQSGFVEYAFFTGTTRYRDLFRTSSQWWAYNDCVQRFRHRHRWLAFIDADEFIVLQEPQYQRRPSWTQQQAQAQTQARAQMARGVAAAAGGSDGSSGASAAGGSNGGSSVAAVRAADISTFLQQYEQYGGLALNWVIFGSSGHTVRPRGGVLVNYHACLPLLHEQNTHVKVIANTKYLMTVGDDPHRVYYEDSSHWTVNELGEQVTQARTATPSHTKIALFHYLTKSEQEYMQKMRRGSAAGNYKSPEFFYTINQYATDTCTPAIPLGLKCCPTVLAELGAAGVKQAQQRLTALQAKGSGAGGGVAGAAGKQARRHS